MLFIIKGSEGDYDSYYEYVTFACEILDEGVTGEMIEDAHRKHIDKLLLENGCKVAYSKITGKIRKKIKEIYTEHSIINYVKSNYNVKVFNNFYEIVL